MFNTKKKNDEKGTKPEVQSPKLSEKELTLKELDAQEYFQNALEEMKEKFGVELITRIGFADCKQIASLIIQNSGSPQVANTAFNVAPKLTHKQRFEKQEQK